MPNQFVAAERIAKRRGFTRADLDALRAALAALGRAGLGRGPLRPRDPPRQGAGPRRGRPAHRRDRDRRPRPGPAGDHARGPGQAASRCSTAACTRRARPRRSPTAPRRCCCVDERRARDLGLRPRARIVAQCLIGDEPYYHLDGPVAATERVLERSGMTIGDIDVFEVNEAFASVVLSWTERARARSGPGQRQRRRDRARPPGGQHRFPAAHHGPARARARATPSTALITMCAGGAMATATIIERL